MTTQATAVLLDSAGIEMSESVPMQYYFSDGETLRLYSLRDEVAVWVELRVPGLDPVRVPVRAGGKYMESGDTMTLSITVD